jgi:hypothetical protein
MRHTIILITLLQLNISSFGQTLDISITIDTCVDARFKNRVSFVIENRNSIDYWIKTELLTYYFQVIDINGQSIGIKTTRHLNLIGNNEYTKIEKSTKVTIEWLADFFDNYDFQINHEYYIVASYEYPNLTRDEKKKSKKTDFKLVQSKIEAKSNRFRICIL